MDNERGLLTTGGIAEALCVKVHVVNFVLHRLNVQPVGRAGHYRLFDSDVVNQVREELAARAQRRQDGGAA